MSFNLTNWFRVQRTLVVEKGWIGFIRVVFLSLMGYINVVDEEAYTLVCDNFYLYVLSKF